MFGQLHAITMAPRHCGSVPVPIVLRRNADHGEQAGLERRCAEARQEVRFDGRPSCVNSGLGGDPLGGIPLGGTWLNAGSPAVAELSLHKRITETVAHPQPVLLFRSWA